MLKRYCLQDFWEMGPAVREEALLAGIEHVHGWHYERNPAYRSAVSARGVGAKLGATELSRLLRPTAATFKSYIDVLGTGFPQDDPSGFLEWLAAQISVPLELERFRAFRKRYASLEAFFRALEREFADVGLQNTYVERHVGPSDDHGPGRPCDRIDRGRLLPSFPAFLRHESRPCCHLHDASSHPYRDGPHGSVQREPRGATARSGALRHSLSRLSRPGEGSAAAGPCAPECVASSKGASGTRPSTRSKPIWSIRCLTRVALRLLKKAARAKEKVLLFGSPAQLHRVALSAISDAPAMVLAPGSLLGTGGGMKDQYPFSADEIRGDLARAFPSADGGAVPIRDVYGMAEANWAAMQCREGNYHIPPWVHCVTLDDDDHVQSGVETSGILGFFDPFGGGRLFPAFFKTSDRVKLSDGGRQTRCPCGEACAYISRDSIQRADLFGEAGCAAQL